MGQKAHPYSLRMGINRTWSNFWYGDNKNYKDYTRTYIMVEELWKKYVDSNLYDNISVQIATKEIVIYVQTHKPSLIIGQKGVNINRIQSQIYSGLIKKLPGFSKAKLQVNIKIKEITPETSPAFICEQLSDALISKRNYKNSLKYYANMVMKSGCKGMKIKIKGRINGVAIARTVKYNTGSVPLQTLTTNINYNQKHVLTKSGCCGVTCIIAS